MIPLLFFTLLLSFLLHEAGHFLYGRYFLNMKDTRYIFMAKDKLYSAVEIPEAYSLTRRQVYEFNAWGILLGFLPPVIYATIVNPVVAIACFTSYLWGCKRDLLTIIKLIKEARK